MATKIWALEDYIEKLNSENLIAAVSGDEEAFAKKIQYISYNSNDIKKGTLFICKGEHFKEEYLENAVKEGAIAYIGEKKYPNIDVKYNLPCIVVSDMRKTMAYVANMFYNRIWKDISLIGITGTKGKSTTAYFMRSILDKYMKSTGGAKSGLLSGIENYDGIISEESRLTTPETFEFHKHLDNAVKCKIQYMTMEVSSQALKYHRTLGVEFEVGCFLNIGQDHISGLEHSDFEDYFSSKLRIFSQCGTACVNMDSDYSERILKEAEAKAPRVITFGTKTGVDIYGYGIKTYGQGIAFSVKSPAFDEEFRIDMPGIFNVSNALAAVAVSYSLNIPVKYVKKGLAEAHAEGRMEVYTSKDKEICVIVDYAHNKMSFEALFRSMKKEFPDKKIFIVFGCPGKKALSRRKELGEIAGQCADYVYITEEDAGEEPLEKICGEIAENVGKYQSNYEIIQDRGEAIKRAIEQADKDTIVLVTGKGRETRQKRGTSYINTPSDVEYVKEFLRARK